METAGPASPSTQTPAERQAAAERMTRLAHESGRTFFDVLEPSVRETDIDLARGTRNQERLGGDIAPLAGLRRHRGCVLVHSAVFIHAGRHERGTPGNGAGLRKARRLRKCQQGGIRDFHGRCRTGRRQYIDWLLDFLDEYKRGLNDSTEHSARSPGIPARVRSGLSIDCDENSPLLSDDAAAAERLVGPKGLRSPCERGTRFVAIGQLHVLGSDGVPRQLERLGIQVESRP